MGVLSESATLDFRPLALSDKPLVDAALARFPPEVSELTFTNLFCWQSKRQVSVAEHGGGLVFLAQEAGRSFFLPPVCMCDAVSAARAMFEHARGAGFEPVMERVPEAMADELGRGRG